VGISGSSNPDATKIFLILERKILPGCIIEKFELWDVFFGNH